MKSPEPQSGGIVQSRWIMQAIRNGLQPTKRSATRMLTVVKNRHCYIYRYNDATRREVMLALGRAASDPAHALTWKDAAALSQEALATGTGAAGSGS